MGDKYDQGGRDDQDITEELDAYYQDRGRSGRGSTILYGLFALVVTLIVAAGLFFGGRAVYRALTGTSGEDGTSSETSQQEDQDLPGNGEGTQDSETGNGSNQTPGVSPDTTDENSETEDDAQSQTDGGSSENIPSTGDNLPRTGSPSGI